MSALLDNMLALIVGGTVLLILLNVQTRTTEQNVRQVSNYAAKKQAVDLATWMEDELLRMGENMNADYTTNGFYEVPFSNPVDSAGQTVSFTLSRDSLASNGDTLRVDVRYRLRKKGTVLVGTEPADAYALDREVRLDGGAWQLGRTNEALGHFRIQMLDENAQPVADPAAAVALDPDAVRNTRVFFTLITPYQTQRADLRRLHYGSTLMIRRQGSLPGAPQEDAKEDDRIEQSQENEREAGEQESRAEAENREESENRSERDNREARKERRR